MPRETNSLINDLMSNTTRVPTVGMGATRLGWTDRYPYTIVEVINERRIVVQADNYRVIRGSAHDGSAEYEYTPDIDAPLITVTKRKDGKWREMGRSNLFTIGERSRYYDPTF